MNLSFIGFGVAGYGLAKGLKGAGIKEIYFIDTQRDTPPFSETIRKRATEIDAIYLDRIQKLAEKTDIMISCVTGSVALSIVEQTAPYLDKNNLYIDVNATSPMVKEQIAAVIEKSGAAFVDAAMMGPVPTFLHRVPILASGSGAARFKAVMEPYGMQIHSLGDKPGKASGIKMFRSIFMKGLVALLIEMLMAARKYEAEAIVLRSIAETIDKTNFMETVQTIFPKGITSAERMTHEMEEVIETLQFLNLPSDMTRAVREKLDWCSRLGLREEFGGNVPESLDTALRALEDKAVRMPQDASD
ncbi:MAG: NAD(P)-binding domain-containing protein [Desulfobacterales bacterium]|nr:NAD(P)-binding domain-containing protein [Desulfobacterales bacterium]